MARGALLLVAVAAVAACGGWAVSTAARKIGWPGLVLEAAGLRLSIGIGGLIAACRAVERFLVHKDLEEARHLAGYHLVSRSARALDGAHVASAAIESASENLTDAFAPLCFYLVFGLAGAWLYRAVNTADAMVGYREGALEFFGKASARLDDVLNLIPARFRSGRDRGRGSARRESKSRCVGDDGAGPREDVEPQFGVDHGRHGRSARCHAGKARRIPPRGRAAPRRARCRAEPAADSGGGAGNGRRDARRAPPVPMRALTSAADITRLTESGEDGPTALRAGGGLPRAPAIRASFLTGS